MVWGKVCFMKDNVAGHCVTQVHSIFSLKGNWTPKKYYIFYKLGLQARSRVTLGLPLPLAVTKYTTVLWESINWTMPQCNLAASFFHFLNHSISLNVGNCHSICEINTILIWKKKLTFAPKNALTIYLATR